MARPIRLSEEEKKEWINNFLKKYIQIELQNKYFNVKDNLNYEYMGIDRRRIPTAIKLYKERNLILNVLEPNHKEIKKIISLPENNTPPSFNKKVYQEYSKEKIITNKFQMFKNILNFKHSEMIYIYNNQNKFIFKISGSTLLVLSKETYNKIDELVLMAYAEKKIDEDINTILSYSLDLRIKAIHEERLQWNKNITLEKLTEEFLSEKIDFIHKELEILKRRAKETKILHRYVTRFGKERFRARLIKHGYDYLTSIAPVWIMGEDNRKIKIAKIVLEGLPEE